MLESHLLLTLDSGPKPSLLQKLFLTTNTSTPAWKPPPPHLQPLVVLAILGPRSVPALLVMQGTSGTSPMRQASEGDGLLHGAEVVDLHSHSSALR